MFIINHPVEWIRCLKSSSSLSSVCSSLPCFWFYLQACVLICVVTCVSFRVSDSVEKNRRQLQGITDRIKLAQARVDKIKGSKKATKVTQHLHFWEEASGSGQRSVTSFWIDSIAFVCVYRFSPVLSTQPQIDFRITHLFSLRLQTPPHRFALDSGYRINSVRLMKRPYR